MAASPSLNLAGTPDMKIVRRSDAPPYVASKHIGVDAFRLQGPPVSSPSFCGVGLSFYEPGGRAEMDAGPTEKLYVLLEGSLTVSLASGETATLEVHDSCLIESNEMRAVENRTDRQAVLLVITPPPVA